MFAFKAFEKSLVFAFIAAILMAIFFPLKHLSLVLNIHVSERCVIWLEGLAGIEMSFMPVSKFEKGKKSLHWCTF